MLRSLPSDTWRLSQLQDERVHTSHRWQMHLPVMIDTCSWWFVAVRPSTIVVIPMTFKLPLPGPRWGPEEPPAGLREGRDPGKLNENAKFGQICTKTAEKR